MKNIYEIILESLNDDVKKVFQEIMDEYYKEAQKKYSEFLKGGEKITKEQLINTLSEIFDGRAPIEEFFNRTN